jgi:hypothetical protein
MCCDLPLSQVRLPTPCAALFYAGCSLATVLPSSRGARSRDRACSRRVFPAMVDSTDNDEEQYSVHSFQDCYCWRACESS